MSNQRSSQPHPTQSDSSIFDLQSLNLSWLKIAFSLIHRLLTFIFQIQFERLNLVQFFNLQIFYLRNGFTNNKAQKSQLIKWIYSKTNGKILVENFNSEFADGIILCALLDALIPGLCPRYDLLSHSNGFANISMALDLIKSYLKISTDIRIEDIMNGVAENQLIYLLSRIKLASTKIVNKSEHTLPSTRISDSDGQIEFDTYSEPDYLIKGMGLILAVKGRKAHFNIFFEESSQVNLIIEIIGPENSICKERVTNIQGSAIQRSINRHPTELYRSKVKRQDNQDQSKNHILLWYRVFKNKIAVYYVPSVEGSHTISIISRGRHVVGSPYSLIVNTSIDSDCKPIDLYSIALHENDFQVAIETLGRCVSRRVIRQTLIVNGEEIPTHDDLKSICCAKKFASANRESFKKNSAQSLNGHSDEDLSLIPLNFSQTDESSETFNFKNRPLIVINEDNEMEDGIESIESTYDDYKEDQSNISHDQVNTFICEDKKGTLISSDDNDDSSMMTCEQKPSEDIYFDSKIVFYANQETVSFNQKECCKSIYYSKTNLYDNLKRTYTHPKMNEIKQVVQTLDSQRYNNFWQIINGVNYLQDCNHQQLLNMLQNSLALTSEADYTKLLSNAMNVIKLTHSNINKCVEKTLPIIKSSKDQDICLDCNNSCSKSTLNQCLNEKKYDQTLTTQDLYLDIKSNQWSVSSKASSECTSEPGFIEDDVFDYSNIYSDSLLNQSKLYENEFGLYPKKVIAFGSELNAGKINEDNYFIISTKSAGRSFLSIGIQSNFEDAVNYLNLTYLGDYHYKVNYKITRPGYYILFIRWGDCDIANSPSLLKIF